MKSAAKGVLYVLFLVVAVASFGRFRAAYTSGSAREGGLAARGAAASMVEDVREPEATPEASGAGTNPVVAATATNSAVAQGTNALVAAVGSTNPAAGQGGGVAGKAGQGKGPAGGNAQALYLSGFILGMLGLAGLMAWDVSQWMARKAAHGLGVDFAPIEGDPEYDAAEQAWANGDHLEAINLLRDFLKRRPNQQHAALRIAEIYEKDLGNPLAAALELEEVLQRRLPREKWGWTAVHLANLYSGKLNQTDKAIEVLHRIVEEYPETAAAKKARQRLGIPESGTVASAPAEADASAAPAGGEGVPEDDSMPKGFKVRARKK